MLRILADVAKAVSQTPGPNELLFRYRFTPAHKRMIDAVGEAEVYLFYQQYHKAKYVLQQALKFEPQNLDAKLLLLQIHASQGASKDYCLLAQELQHTLQHTAHWQQICLDGQALAPGHPLFLAKAA